MAATFGRLGVLLSNLTKQQEFNVSIAFIALLNLHQHCLLYWVEMNPDCLHRSSTPVAAVDLLAGAPKTA